MKQDKQIIGVTISPELLKLIEDGKYNRSKLIDDLLTEHFNKKKKK